MATKIVFLNMSDLLLVDGRKAIDALRHKHPKQKTRRHPFAGVEQVQEIPMVEFYQSFISGNHHATYQADLRNIRAKCLGADQVMLSIHGPMKHVDYGIIKDPMNPANDIHVSYQQLGILLLTIFNNMQHNYNLTLVMCFGARSSRFRLDHQDLDQIDWSDSFAYKLFEEISPRRQVRMTARTGELSFNTVTGVSEVQTELSIQGTLDNQDISQEQLVIDTQTWVNTNRARLLAVPGSPTDNFLMEIQRAQLQANRATGLQQLRQLRRNHNLPAGLDRGNLLTYLANVIRLVEASSRQEDPVQGKYGKMVYKYIHGMGNAVFAKYPNPICVYPPRLGNSYAVNANVLAKLRN